MTSKKEAAEQALAVTMFTLIRPQRAFNSIDKINIQQLNEVFEIF
ncbi:unnamed protein product [Paramecium sonneborni]|uniref:Uncharacterized protein n=1 Tax=Paramecium sonneborni TaxID=65129 RepID=A0A8S1PE76_9CILI|nr:unnamed protein product [Paramecium sonneborni]